MATTHFNQVETNSYGSGKDVAVRNPQGIVNYTWHVWVGRLFAYSAVLVFIVAIFTTGANQDTNGKLFTGLAMGAFFSWAVILFLMALQRENKSLHEIKKATLETGVNTTFVRSVTIYNYSNQDFSDKTVYVGSKFIDLYEQAYDAWKLKDNFPSNFDWEGLQQTLFIMATTIKQISNSTDDHGKVRNALVHEMQELSDSFTGYLSSAQEYQGNADAIKREIVEDTAIENLQNHRFTL